jgi:tripartite-type tricarboxylate transporter receptor subunit TctC
MKKLALFAAAFLVSSTAAFAQDAAAPAPVVAPAPAEAPIDTSSLSYSNKWRVKFDNRADSDGEITFLVVLKDAEPVTIVVPIKKGTSENSIASVVKDTLKKSVPKGVKVERDDGEDVLVKYKDRFSLTLKGNTVKDLDINLDKE